MFVFDLTSCQSSGKTKRHGGGEYATIILNELIKREVRFKCVYTTDLNIDVCILNRCLKRNIECLDYKNVGLLSVLKSIGCTTFYSALPYTYGKLKFEGINFIGTIHGLRDLEIQSDKYMHLYSDSFISMLKSLMKETFLYRKIAFKRNYRRFDELFRNVAFKYIVVSNHTKYSLQCFFPLIDSSSIFVFYSPSIVSQREHKESEERFYLLVSGNRWMKNSYRALKAIDNLISKGLVNHKTIVTGSCPKYLIKKLDNDEYFKFLPYVTDEELSSLMQKAYCFLYPTLNEGFGYPPLQAMGCGTPVIASACCSIPEVCATGALYFNPYSISEIENRLLQLENPDIRKSLIEEGYKRFLFIQERQQRDLDNLISFILE